MSKVLIKSSSAKIFNSFLTMVFGFNVTTPYLCETQDLNTFIIHEIFLNCQKNANYKGNIVYFVIYKCYTYGVVKLKGGHTLNEF